MTKTYKPAIPYLKLKAFCDSRPLMPDNTRHAILSISDDMDRASKTVLYPGTKYERIQLAKPYLDPQTEMILKHYGYGRSLDDPEFHRLYWAPYPLSRFDYDAFTDVVPLLRGVSRKALGAYLDKHIPKSVRYQVSTGNAAMSWDFYDALMPVLYLYGYNFPFEEQAPREAPFLPEVPAIDTDFKLKRHAAPARRIDQPLYGHGRKLTDELYQAIYHQPYPLHPDDIRAMCEEPWSLRRNILWQNIDLDKDHGVQVMAGLRPVNAKFYAAVMPVLYLHGFDFGGAIEIEKPEPIEPDTEFDLENYAVPNHVQQALNDEWHPEHYNLAEKYGFYRSLKDPEFTELLNRPYDLRVDCFKEMTDKYGKWALKRNLMFSNFTMDPAYRRQIIAGQKPMTRRFYEEAMAILYLHGYDFP